MPERSPAPAIVACFTEFEAAVRRVAIEIVREVLARELAAVATLASPQPSTKRSAASAPTRRGRRGKPSRAVTTAAAEAEDRGPAPAAEPADAAQVQAASGSTPATSEPAPPPPTASGAPPSANGSSRDWSRTRVVNELADWLLQDPTIDAATLKRRGQGALASWALRLFGRFDAALNAANLHLAEKYPDGPPKRGVRAPPATNVDPARYEPA